MLQDRKFKDLMFNEFSNIGKCLSSPKRIEILDLLISGPKSVEKLAHITQMSVANVSKHLQTLSMANLVIYTKEKNYVYYQLASNKIIDFLAAFYQISENQRSNIKNIKEKFINDEPLQVLGLDELKAKVDIGEILLLDVRPTEEYESGHFPGAISIPLEDLQEKLSDLPQNVQIAAYCRGNLCLTSLEAVEILNKKGYKAFKLEDNVLDWKKIK
ncbi:ArsR family transcriptional regulator [Staphylococcus gallinarum]|uniref:ArsR family transcriptional regulator n=2 Tax=Staphylococcus TaxID=1279 RepID=A0A418HNP5_STAGA|nr:metalloregulator ArsR/SmtB family transcription factor [Staphylococcus gallinarum]RIL42943.1 ArsR family transcriptional regulator [Staphylococcus gallinarum]RIO91982.1 ArsR family transcriptional regulator [Staphylococcus gallinarum]